MKNKILSCICIAATIVAEKPASKSIAFERTWSEKRVWLLQTDKLPKWILKL